MSRLLCKSTTYDVQLIIDINTEVYPMAKDERFSFKVAHAVVEGKANDGLYDQSGAVRPELQHTLQTHHCYTVPFNPISYDDNINIENIGLSTR